MADSLTIVPGARIRQDGKSYKVVDLTTAEVNLLEYVAQKNRHLAMHCPDAECRQLQIDEKRKRALANGRKPRRLGPDILRGCDISAMPNCGMCGKPMVWRDEKPQSETTSADPSSVADSL